MYHGLHYYYSTPFVKENEVNIVIYHSIHCLPKNTIVQF